MINKCEKRLRDDCFCNVWYHSGSETRSIVYVDDNADTTYVSQLYTVAYRCAGVCVYGKGLEIFPVKLLVPLMRWRGRPWAILRAKLYSCGWIVAQICSRNDLRILQNSVFCSSMQITHVWICVRLYLQCKCFTLLQIASMGLQTTLLIVLTTICVTTSHGLRLQKIF